MPFALYIDQHVSRAITIGLRPRNVDVLTAFEDGAGDGDDPELLDHTSALGRVLFSQDDKLLIEAARHSWHGTCPSCRARRACVAAHEPPVQLVTPGQNRRYSHERRAARGY